MADAIPKTPFNSKFPQWVLLLGIVLFYFFVFSRNSGVNLEYGDFKQLVQDGKVREVTILGFQEIRGILNSEDSGKVTNFPKNMGRYFETLIPAIGDSSLLPLLEQHKVKIKAENTTPGPLMSVLLNLLPWIIIFGFFYYQSKKLGQLPGGMRPPGMGPFSPLGKDRKKEEKKKKVTYSDVAGQKNAKKELTEIVDFLKNPEKFQKLGAELPKGILLVGPPGTGKTLMAKATAGEADVEFFSISGSEFIELYVGMGASRVRNLFQTARKAAPSIIFIDEIDSIGRSRGSGLGGGHDEREQTLNQILSEMDGFSTEGPVVVMAATNRPDVLDSALTRPGRFDRQVILNLPQVKAREEILNLYAKKIPLDSHVDLSKVAQSTMGFSGADLKNLVNEAALQCARRNGSLISDEDFSLARDKVLWGVPRDEQIRAKDKEIIAVHESGHAIVALKINDADPVRKVTIVPRGMALGHTEQVPSEDQVNLSRSYLLSQIKILLGGRLAEEIVFNEITTGAENDLKRATQLARKMVMNWGMSEKIGPLAFKQGEDHMFLGKELGHPRDYSERTAELIDEEVRSLLLKSKEETFSLLTENKDLLLSMTSELIEKETLVEEDIKKYTV